MQASERLLADEEMLAALGYEPVEFTRASAAPAGRQPKRFDALLVGRLSSAASALDLAVALHEIVPNVPILLATASADERGAEALLATGIFEVVHRPLISAELASALGALPDRLRDLGQRTTAVRRFSPTEIMP